jgi:Ca2+:H+ antiporter
MKTSLEIIIQTLCREGGVLISGLSLLLFKHVDLIAFCNHYQALRVTFLFILIILITFCAFNVIDHAHFLSREFGEPHGTLILTISSVTIEVGMILALLSRGGGIQNFQNTSFAVFMLSINLFIALSVVIGGLRYNRQNYNLKGASSYLGIMIFTSSLCFILPKYTSQAIHGISKLQSVCISLVCFILYGNFLIAQTITHQDYFRYLTDQEEQERISQPREIAKILYRNLALLMGLIIMVNLSKFLAHILQLVSHQYHLSGKFPSLVVAALILMPEGVSAIKSSYNNELQRSINLCLGSAVASLNVTIPAFLLYNAFYIQEKLVLGLGTFEQLILAVTYLISTITFTSSKTSSIYGMLSLGIFVVYLILS